MYRMPWKNLSINLREFSQYQFHNLCNPEDEVQHTP